MEFTQPVTQASIYEDIKDEIGEKFCYGDIDAKAFLEGDRFNERAFELGLLDIPENILQHILRAEKSLNELEG